MLASSRLKQPKRRGIVLVLILGVLALLAVIGVTFATFTGQTRVGARNFAQSVQRPLQSDLMDFALSQLIGDTADVRSAIRGHSMARDMYGNDAASNGYLASRPDGAGVGPYNNSTLLRRPTHQVGCGYEPLRFSGPTSAINDPGVLRLQLHALGVAVRLHPVANPVADSGYSASPWTRPSRSSSTTTTQRRPWIRAPACDGVHRVFRVSPADGTTHLNNPTLRRAQRARRSLPAVWTSIPAPPLNSTSATLSPSTAATCGPSTVRGWGRSP